jgi:hypothetical protein
MAAKEAVQNAKQKRRRKTPKRVLALPDLEQKKSAAQRIASGNTPKSASGDLECFVGGTVLPVCFGAR